MSISKNVFLLALVLLVPDVRSECEDTRLQIRIPGITDDNDKPITTRCKLVGENTEERCKWTGVSQACPVTCGACDKCEDPDPALRFKFLSWRGKIMRNCDFIKRIPKKKKNRCKRSANICRDSCGEFTPDICKQNTNQITSG